MTILFAVLRVAWPYILGAIVLGVGYYKAQTWCNHACRDVTVERDELAGTLKAAQERATALALLWAKSVDDAEAKERQREQEATRRYDSLLARAQAINRGSGMRFSAGAIRVLNDATDLANAAAPPAVDQKPPEAVSETPADTTDEREIAIAWVKASEAYADAYGKWQACVNFYEGIREQGRLEKPSQ